MTLEKILGELCDTVKTLQPVQSRLQNYDRMIEGFLNYNISLENYEQEGPTLNLQQKQLHKQVFVNNIEQCLELSQYINFDHELLFEEKLSNKIVDLEFTKYRLKLEQNKNNELQQIQEGLCNILEQNQINLNNFSENTLTNVGKYNHFGDLQDINYLSVPIQNKRYTDEDILNKLPHPVRMRKYKKIKKSQTVSKKNQEDILEEFNLLSNLFTIKNKNQEFNDYKNVLDILDFNQTQYNDLWEEILKDIDLNQHKQKKKNLVNQVLGSDEKFNETVERIIKETAEYVKELNDQFEEQQEQVQQTQKKQQQEENDKQIVEQKIIQQTKKQQKKKPVLSQSQYQYAIEDQTDLMHFYDQLPREKFATSFPFELDQFQKRSILHLERKQSVFVAAHTSAGKTVVAEYGIALAMKHKRKVIYTSPIKALSNQKYRQFLRKFGSVGIVTGDITMNQEANCVIMTTEILRNQLYKGADMIRDIEWVIFDQVHYINNQQRGVVWEETIIMLPEHIGIIMLSATVPNFMAFANWVGRTKRRKIYVMKTFHRPVPLEHSLYIFDRFHVIKYPNGQFLKQEYETLINQIQRHKLSAEQLKQVLKAQKKKKIQQRGFYKDNKREQAMKLHNKMNTDKFIKNVNAGDIDRYKDRQQTRLFSQLIEECRKQKLLPCVIFCFSKRKIQTIAESIYTTRLNTNQESHKVIQFFTSALINLKPEDKQLNQFQFLLEICKNGYAVHHSDLLPLAKEIVELLFEAGLIKVLLATETFAMGINMPTKTVIFHTIKKVGDASSMQRFLNSSQYVQMSGRAGRRGLDEKGTVIILVKEIDNLPKSSEMIKMIDYPGEPLVSKFRITYQIILNLFNSKDLNVEEMMRQSFFEDPKFSSLPLNQARIKQYKKTYDQLSNFVCPYNQIGTRLLIEEYLKAVQTNRQLNQISFSEIETNKFQLPRFGLVLGHNNQTQLCVVLKFDFQNIHNRIVQILIVNQIDTQFYLTRKQRETEQLSKGINKKKRIILQYQNSKNEKIENAAVPDTKNKFHFYIHSIKASQLIEIYGNKLTTAKYASYTREAYEQLAKILLEQSSKKLIPLNYYDNNNKQTQFKKLLASKCHQCQFKEQHTKQYNQRTKIKNTLIELIAKVDKNTLGFTNDFEGMVRVLEQYKFLSSTTILLKGKVARQVDIYVTQILVEAVLDNLNKSQIAGLLSGFVCQHRTKTKKMDQKKSPFKNQDSSVYSEQLYQAMQKTYQIVKKINQQQSRLGAFIVDDDQQLVNEILNFHLTRQIHDWANGDDFIDICDTTDAPEGSIVKTILRLDILLRNIKTGCMIMGNTKLAEKIDQTSEAIKRDIVFTQSLYLT